MTSLCVTRASRDRRSVGRNTNGHAAGLKRTIGRNTIGCKGSSGGDVGVVDDEPATSVAADGASRELSCLLFANERMFRELLASLLAIRTGIRVVGQAASISEADRQSGEHRADLLIVVVPPGDSSAFEMAREYVTARPEGRVVVIGSSAAGFTAPDWLRGRCAAVIDRQQSVQSLWNALDTVIGDQRGARKAGLRRRLGGQSLSQRETEIFGYIGDGLTNKQIAVRLGLSDHTVRTHRKRIAAKLGTEGGELTRWAIVSRQGEIVAEADA